MPTKFKTRVEQVRQARKIHGGTAKLCAAAVGVKLARLPIPSRRLREQVFRTLYGRKYPALCEDQLERPLGEFRSLNELFTRGVRPEFRPLAMERDSFLCPCDSTIQDVGRLARDELLTVKGVEYKLKSLLPNMDVRHFENGPFAIFFLSPLDCHRVFCPQQATLHEIVHVPGRRLLVHPPFQRKEFPVFSLNERTIIRLATPLGECLLVLVAGWGVGNITHPFPGCLRPKKRRITRQTFDEPRTFARGEWLATFELGSTVIMIVEPQAKIFTHIARDEHVKYGQAAFSFSNADPECLARDN
jgi:phosphatidylserine decarboxylase